MSDTAELRGEELRKAIVSFVEEQYKAETLAFFEWIKEEQKRTGYPVPVQNIANHFYPKELLDTPPKERLSKDGTPEEMFKIVVILECLVHQGKLRHTYWTIKDGKKVGESSSAPLLKSLDLQREISDQVLCLYSVVE